MENMYLASHALGIGAVWINQLRENKSEAVREVLNEFSIPDNHISFGMCALGYSDEIPTVKERTEKVVFI